MTNLPEPPILNTLNALVKAAEEMLQWVDTAKTGNPNQARHAMNMLRQKIAEARHDAANRTPESSLTDIDVAQPRESDRDGLIEKLSTLGKQCCCAERAICIARQHQADPFRMPDGRPIFGGDSPHDIGEHLHGLCSEAAGQASVGPALGSSRPADGLRSALERVTACLRLSIQGKPIRDMDEVLAEADCALQRGESLVAPSIKTWDRDDPAIDIINGLHSDIDEIIRVAKTNPSDIQGFLKANYPKQWIRRNWRTLSWQ